MPTRHHSQLAKIIQTLRLLNPTSLKDPIDAKTMGDLANLTPKQVSPCLSILHYTGYLTRIGTLGRYALYIRTTKPMPRRSSPIEKRYKRHLGRRSCRYYTTSPKQIAIEVSQAVITALRQEEIFSNLKFTQRLYDVLIDQGSITPPDPVDLSRAISAACEVLPELLREDGVRIDQLVTGSDIDALLAEIHPDNGEQARELLEGAFQDSQAYYKRWIEKARPTTRGRAVGGA